MRARLKVCKRPISQPFLRFQIKITGGLLSSVDKILQILEGPRDLVTSAYNRIARDDRHTGIVILSAGPTERRFFRDGSMRFFGDTALNRETILEFAATDRFEPARLSADSTASLLRSLGWRPSLDPPAMMLSL